MNYIDVLVYEVSMVNGYFTIYAGNLFMTKSTPLQVFHPDNSTIKHYSNGFKILCDSPIVVCEPRDVIRLIIKNDN